MIVRELQQPAGDLSLFAVSLPRPLGHSLGRFRSPPRRLPTHSMAELEKYKPTHVLNAAGVTGRPNVDWCEDNQEATLRANVIGTMSPPVRPTTGAESDTTTSSP